MNRVRRVGPSAERIDRTDRTGAVGAAMSLLPRGRCGGAAAATAARRLLLGPQGRVSGRHVRVVCRSIGGWTAGCRAGVAARRKGDLGTVPR